MNKTNILEQIKAGAKNYRLWGAVFVLLFLLGGFFLVTILHSKEQPSTTDEKEVIDKEETVDRVEETDVSTNTAEQDKETKSAAVDKDSKQVPEEEAASPEKPKPIQEKVVPAPIPVPPATSDNEDDNQQGTFGVTEAHKVNLLQTHNQARAEVGVSPLTWSKTVAARAQAWADELGRQGCTMTHSDGPYGENLAYEWTSESSAALDPASAVSRWVAEKNDYNYTTNTCAAGAVCGHYTQVVWADSTQLGCGVAVCTERNFTQLWVCQYNPPGNYVGEKPY